MVRSIRAEDSLTTFGEAAAELGTTYPVIAGLVKAHRIKIKRFRMCHTAKGLDPDDMNILRRSLGKPVVDCAAVAS